MSFMLALVVLCASARVWNLDREDALPQIREHYQPSNEVLLSMSVGAPGLRFGTILRVQAAHFGVRNILTITNRAENCDHLIQACGYSSMYMNEVPTQIMQQLRARVYWMYRLYRIGLNVFQLDSDVVWFQNPYKAFAEFPNHGIIGAEDGLPFNGGFVYARHLSKCNNLIIEWLLHTWSWRLIVWGGDEQSTLIDIVSSMITQTPYATEQEVVARGKASVIPVRERRIPWVRAHATKLRGESEYRIKPVASNMSFATYQRFAHDAPTIPRHCRYAHALGVTQRFTYNLKSCNNPLVYMLHLSGFPLKQLRPSIVQLYRSVVNNESNYATDEFRRFICGII